MALAAIIPRRVLNALALVLSLGGVAYGQNGTDDAAKRSANTRVRPGDRVALLFHRDRELSADVSVNEHGEAAFPKIGMIRVAQMTIGQLQDTLRARYAEFLRVPELDVQVLRRIVVNGEVRVPNVYMVDGASTVRDVIARAGGITEAGNKNNVSIIREGASIKVKGWDRGTEAATDLQSGDQVIVGRKSWLSMNLLSVVSTGVLVSSFVISLRR